MTLDLLLQYSLPCFALLLKNDELQRLEEK